MCALLGGGGYAEYAAVRYDMTMPVPQGCTMAEAAALPEAFATAYLNLVIEGGIRAGDVFLMHAGASGLASVVIPMAKSFGAYVVTTIIDEEKRAAVARTGADRIVNTRTEDIVSVLRELDEAGRPVRLAIDCLGGEIMGQCLPHLAYMAKWIMIATLAGDFTTVDMRKLYVRNVRVIGSTLRSKPESVKAEILRCLVRYVWGKVSCGESVRRSSAFSRSRRQKRRTRSCMTARAPEKSYCTSPDNGAENEKTSDENRTFFIGARRRREERCIPTPASYRRSCRAACSSAPDRSHRRKRQEENPHPARITPPENSSSRIS